jgi:gamma-glutamyltranspeptidase/glutathione hydrolase
MAPLVRDYGNDRVAFLPPPADGGLAAEAAFNMLVKSPDAVPAANALALAVAARWRAGGVTSDSLLAAQDLPPAGNTAYPASTSFVTMDRNGNAVACALTMNNLFGTGRILPGLGFIPAASPSAVQPALLSAGLVWNNHIKAFRAAAAASGQSAAPVSVAVGLVNTLRSYRPMSVPVPDPGRLNIISCSGYMPGENGRCGWATDPRGDGLAMGAN